MSETVLRQPLTFWQWITGQPGTIYSPPLPPAPPAAYVPPPPRTALNVIEDELCRLHSQIDDIKSEDLDSLESKAGLALIAKLDKLYDELARRSNAESPKA